MDTLGAMWGMAFYGISASAPCAFSFEENQFIMAALSYGARQQIRAMAEKKADDGLGLSFARL